METKKIKLGFGAGSIVALTFCVIGGIFTALGVTFLLNLDALRRNSTGSGDVRILPLIFGGIGLLFLLSGLAVAVARLHRRLRARRIVNAGYYVTAEVADLRVNFSVQVNGRSPYVMECHYQDPETGVLHVFDSRPLYYCPAELIGKPVRVYVEEGNFGHYYVDADSILPEVERH